MELNQSKQLLSLAITEIAHASNRVADFTSRLSSAHITHDVLVELGMNYMAYHEYNDRTNFMFFDNEKAAQACMLNWFENTKLQNKPIKFDAFQNPNYAAIIFRISPFNDETHVFAVEAL